ncbi:putative oxygen-independent coproporphyrinogen III oxidase [Candidatus Vecturithrix granuli]|uniref:Putative oxygen-independent coproporphyrinogen III oxidase n=1 Tax=Vecturithrix granuli TaxID=1499967 RepID=A0A081BUA5_VECG1|nr:putative oxygen-independent coproporphyrinogen III oxidase [Candidatus Vecturithrix granuli]
MKTTTTFQVKSSYITHIRCHVPFSQKNDVSSQGYAKKLTWAEEPQTALIEPQAIFEAGLRQHHLANTAYPIAHRKTIWDYRQPAERHTPLLKDAFATSDSMCLYAHIPFCERRCAFCEYTVLDAYDEEREAVYHQALLQELDHYLALLGRGVKQLRGFDIGGGTPSLIQAARIGALVERVTQGFRLSSDFDISIETTPKIAALQPEKLAAYRSFGIERISMGLQMVNPKLLHDYGRDLNKIGYNHLAVENIRRAGFQRFNIDVMYGFARQTLEDFRQTLDYTIRLDPEYLTLYRMRYKGTSISGEADKIELTRVIAMYTLAKQMLTEAGYQANPGKNGFSRVAGDPGTSAYLTERVVWSTAYLGLGLGAQTFTNNLLAYNHGAATKRMEHYLQTIQAGELPIQDLYHLPLSEAMAKMLSVSFYFGEIHLGAFRKRFGLELEQRFPDEIAFVLERGLMEYYGQTLRLTSNGANVINGVIALFYSNRVKEHLLALQ